jgi:hypothetical protein
MLACIGLILNCLLLIVDIRSGNVLGKVNKGETITDLITSPTQNMRREIAQNPEMHENVKDYLLNKDQRGALKRSMVKSTTTR